MGGWVRLRLPDFPRERDRLLEMGTISGGGSGGGEGACQVYPCVSSPPGTRHSLSGVTAVTVRDVVREGVVERLDKRVVNSDSTAGVKERGGRRVNRSKVLSTGTDFLDV